MDHFRFSHPTCADTRLRGMSQQSRENPYTGYFPTSPLFSSYSPHPSPVPATLLREGMQTIADQLPIEGNRKKATRSERGEGQGVLEVKEVSLTIRPEPASVPQFL